MTMKKHFVVLWTFRAWPLKRQQAVHLQVALVGDGGARWRASWQVPGDARYLLRAAANPPRPAICWQRAPVAKSVFVSEEYLMFDKLARTNPARVSASPPAFASAKQLARAAVLALMLVPLGLADVEASSITCSFTTAPLGACSDPGSASISGSEALFQFVGYDLDLRFDQVNGEFDVTVTDTLTTQPSLLAGQRLTSFPGFVCVPFADGLDGCVDFHVVAASPGPNMWQGFYHMFFTWEVDTDFTFSNDPGNRIRILHAVGTGPGSGDDVFDRDITSIGTYIPDPGIGGADNDFQNFIVAQAPAVVPEPASILLLGTGVSGLLSVGRRRRRRAAGRYGLPHADFDHRLQSAWIARRSARVNTA
jgi:hypothetical protein